MTLSGAVGGTLLDDIHSKDWLQVYDALPFEVGEIRSSFLVPVVLGLFYLVAGGLTLYADGKINDRVTRSLCDRLDFGLAAFGIGWLAVNLEMSILLFILRVPEPTIWAALGAAGLLNWLALDGTRQGLAIALLCGTVCPLCEILIVNHLGWWHYQRPDFMGITSWTAMCYFFYQPALSNLSRYVWKVLKDK